MYVLFAFLLGIVTQVIDAVLGWGFNIAEGQKMGYLNILLSLALFLPGLSIAVRRLHDTGRSGWWYLIILVPVIGTIGLLVLLALDSQPGKNKWGPNPKEVAPSTDSVTPSNW